MLHLKLHTTSTTGHVVVTVISVGHWQFCRRVFATVLILLPLDLAFVLILSGWVALLAALGGFACFLQWQSLPHNVAATARDLTENDEGPFCVVPPCRI
mgnify:CR=1 FL=1